MVFDIDKLQQAVDTIREFNTDPIENLLDACMFKDGKQIDLPYTAEAVKEWKFIGLSNIEFLKTTD